MTVQARLWYHNIVLILLFTALYDWCLQLIEMSFKELASLHFWLDLFLVHLFETLNLYKKKKNVNSLMLSRFRMASCYNWHVRKKSLTAQSTFDTSTVMVEIKIIQWIIFFADYSISDSTVTWLKVHISIEMMFSGWFITFWRIL